MAHTSIYVAYGSDCDVVVLIEGRFISTVLHGHRSKVCSLCFELKFPHLLSADVGGTCIYWHHQDGSWFPARSVSLPQYPTSISWFGSRRHVVFSTKNGLFLASSGDLASTETKLYKSSVFNRFNNDASLLISHSYKLSVIVFMYTDKSYIPHIIPHPAPIVSCDFHPRENSFITFTKDGIMRFWKQTPNEDFFLAFSMFVPTIGYFVTMPPMFLVKRSIRMLIQCEILFVSDDISPVFLRIDENGLPNIEDASNISRLRSRFQEIRSTGAYFTNYGIDSLIFEENQIRMFTKARPLIQNQDYCSLLEDITYQDLPFHRSTVTYLSFSQSGDSFVSLGEDGVAILWNPTSPTSNSRVISREVESIHWYDKDSFVISKGGFLSIFDVDGNEQKRLFESDKYIGYSLVRDNHMFIFSDRVILESGIISGMDIKSYTVSPTFSIIFLAVISSHGVPSVYTLSSMKRIEIEMPQKPVLQLMFLSIEHLIGLTKSSILIWSYTDSCFMLTSVIQLDNIKGLTCEASALGGRILAYNDSNLYLIDTDVETILTEKGISYITSSIFGDFVIAIGSRIRFYPRWTLAMRLEEPDGMSKSPAKPFDQNILTASKRICSSRYTPSPLHYSTRPPYYTEFIRQTLCYMLEFRAAYNLRICQPDHLPAIPRQYPHRNAFILPDDASEYYRNLLKKVDALTSDLDIFGMRYLVSTDLQRLPSIYALYLAYSTSQSTIVSSLLPTLTVTDLSKTYIPIAVKDPILIEKAVSEALSNTWRLYQSIDSVVLLHIAQGHNSKVSRLFAMLGDTARSEFFLKNFSEARAKKSALKNAYSSLSRHKYEMAASLYLLAGETNLAMSVILDKLNDAVMAVLVARLMDPYLQNNDTLSFIENIKWNDSVLEASVAKFLSKSNIGSILHKALMSKNGHSSTTGDIRPGLFQIYYAETRDKSVANYLSNSLVCDGLAPLGRFIKNTAKCNIYVPTWTETDPYHDIVNTSSSSEEEEDSLSTQKPAFSFNFGPEQYIDDDMEDEDEDGWSDSSSDDNKGNDNYKSPQEDTKLPNNSTEEIDEDRSNNMNEVKDEETNDRVLDAYCSFFEDPTPEQKDKLAGEYELLFGKAETASITLPLEYRQQIINHLSSLIDMCSSLFFESANNVVSPKALYDLCLLLSQISTQDFSRSKPSPGSTPHSVALGLFASSIWNLDITTLCYVLGFENSEDIINMAPIPQTSSFDVDITTPRFPDFVLSLLKKPSQQSESVDSLERDRIFIMCLLMMIFAETYCTNYSIQWSSLVKLRIAKLLNTFHMHQLTLGSPAIEFPEAEEEDIDHLSVLMHHAFLENIDCFYSTLLI